MSVSDVAGAPMKQTLKGVEWTFYPLRLRHFSELEQWARGKVISVAAKAIRGLPAEEAKQVMDSAWRHASRLSFATMFAEMSNDIMRELMDAPDAHAQVLHMSLSQAEQPGGKVTLKAIEDLIDDPDINGNELVDMVYHISGQRQKKKTTDDSPKAEASV